MPNNEGNVAMADLNAPEGSSDGGGGGFGAQLLAKLDLQIGAIGAMGSGVKSEIDKLRREARLGPANVSLPASVFTYQSAQPQVAGNGGSGIGCLIGGPEIGREWSVRQIIVGGTTITATPAGVAWFFITAQPPNELSITEVGDFTHTPLPICSFYSEREMYVPPNSNLWIVITGGTNGTQYVTSVTIQDQAFAPRGTEIDS